MPSIRGAHSYRFHLRSSVDIGFAQQADRRSQWCWKYVGEAIYKLNFHNNNTNLIFNLFKSCKYTRILLGFSIKKHTRDRANRTNLGPQQNVKTRLVN